MTMRNWTSLSAVAVATAVASLLHAAPARAGTYATITVDGNVSDWAGISPSYTNLVPSGSYNAASSGTVDYTNVYIANDANYLYFRYTLATPADPTNYPSNYFIDTDVDNETALGHPTGYGAGDSEIVIQGDTAYQENGGDFNDGALSAADSGVLVGNFATVGTDGYEYRISRFATFTNGDPVFVGNDIALYLESDSGSTAPDETAGPISYTFATAPVPTPEPTAMAAVGLGILALGQRRRLCR